MVYYTIKRIIMLIPILIIVSLLVYLLLDIAPGTVIDTLNIENLNEEQHAALIKQYNLDKPAIYRYGLYMVNLLKGDMGKSDFTGMDVWEIYSRRFPNTLLLAISSIAFGASVGIPLGIFAAKRSGTMQDNATTLFTLLGMSVPVFWFALMLMLQFSLRWELLPAGGMEEGIRSLIMPAVCGGISLMASSCRQTRSSMLEQLNADYLRTARAKGVPERVVINKHALRNAMVPILTTLGTSLGHAIGGAAVIETVFTWRGVGQLAVEAVQNRDATMAMGCTLLTTTLFVLIQLIVDLLYALVDPRIKSRYARPKRIKEAVA